MLANKVIIYDDSCPMCKLYTNWFVAWGFLKPENRIGFSTAPSEVTSHVDLDRGRHEIPLFDRETNETIYGLRALTHILGSRWTWLKPLFRSRPFWLMFYPLYQIITYNRRVIAGCKHCGVGFNCAPDLNRFYRSLYLVIAFTVTSTIALAHFANGGQLASIAYKLILGFGLMTLATGSIKRLTSGSLPTWNHLGNHLTILMIIAILTAPILFLSAPLGWVLLFTTGFIGVFELARRT